MHYNNLVILNVFYEIKYIINMFRSNSNLKSVSHLIN